jgi:hypothetical protein
VEATDDDAMKGNNTDVPTVSLGEPTISGTIDNDAVRAALSKNHDKLQDCYEKQLLERHRARCDRDRRRSAGVGLHGKGASRNRAPSPRSPRRLESTARGLVNDVDDQ